MFTENLEKNYTIKLPKYISKEILEWFEMLDISNNLSEEIIHLVSLSLEEKKLIDSPTHNTCISYANVEEPVLSIINQDDFFNSLYSWQEAINQILYDVQPKDEPKQKKKMLSV